MWPDEDIAERDPDEPETVAPPPAPPPFQGPGTLMVDDDEGVLYPRTIYVD